MPLHKHNSQLLAMVPTPVLAVMLLFPITRETDAADKQADAAGSTDALAPPASLFYMKQTIGNACGTIAMLHCIANARQQLAIGAAFAVSACTTSHEHPTGSALAALPLSISPSSH
jgi:Ubiquitin carboxyl-terminal hydrolase, family 1